MHLLQKLDSKQSLVMVFIIMAFIIIAGGYLFFRTGSREVIRKQNNELELIADMKISQIISWRNERLAEADYFSTRDNVIEKFMDLDNNRDDESAVNYFQEMFGKFNRNHSYDNILLLDDEREFLFRLYPGLDELNEHPLDDLMRTGVEQKVFISDFYIANDDIGLDVIAPLIHQGQTIGYMLFIIDPDLFLFPLIQTWPSVSYSAETLLARQEGDSVLFLNELRHRANTAMKMKLPLSRMDVPAVQAVKGFQGIFEGIDYRGIRVLSYIREIPGSNWYMISKEDKQEIYGQLYTNGLLIISFAIMSILLVSLALTFIYRTRQHNLYKNLFLKEKEVREAERRLRATMDNMMEGCQVIDFGWHYVYTNDALARQARKSREEMLGRTMTEVFPGIEDTEMFRHLEECMDKRISHQMENMFIYPDGSSGWFELSIQPDPQGIFILSVDITRRKELEKQLRQSARMESLGTLAGGISHDFNNILGIILTNVNLLPYLANDQEKYRECLEAIQLAAKRGSEMVRQLMSFAQKRDASFSPIQINDVIRETVAMVEGILPKNIEVKVETSDELPAVMGDATQLHQVLINLCMNARDAMPSGGLIRLTSAMVPGQKARKQFVQAEAEEYILLRVIDNGTGISPDNLQKIFEPFFTTKGWEKGTGLGLPIVYNIISNHRGLVDVVSQVDKGTEFHLYFPADRNLQARA